MRPAPTQQKRRQQALGAQEQFAQAARAGDVVGMQEACKAGASPADEMLEALSSWDLVIRHAPLDSMKACFAFLKEHRIPVIPSFETCSLHPEHHPFFALRNRKDAFPLGGGRALWRLWNCLDTEEHQRLLQTEDMFTFLEESGGGDVQHYISTMEETWSSTPLLPLTDYPFFSKTYRTHLGDIPRLLTTGSPSSTLPASALLLVRSLSLRSGYAGYLQAEDSLSWGDACATAPMSLLHACVRIPQIVSVMQRALVSSLCTFKREGYHEGAHVQQAALRILQRLHKAGIRWPECWPVVARDALYALPAVRRWSEKQEIRSTLTLPPTPASARPRL